MLAFLQELGENTRIAFRAIRTQKLRSLLTTLGIIIGILMVTAMMTIINGLERNFEESMSELGTDVLYVEKWPWRPVSDWWNYINRPNITADLAETITQRAKYVEAVAPVGTTRRTIRYRGQNLSGTRVIGSTPLYPRVRGVDLDAGRFYTDNDARAARNVCVLGAATADGLFPIETPLGKSIRIGPHRFEVIGLLTRQGTSGDADDNNSSDSEIHIPLETLKKLFGTGRRSLSIQVKTASAELMPEAEDELIGILRTARGLDARDQNDFVINKQDTIREFLGPIKATIYGIGIFLTGLSLLVGGIGVMNIMFVSVKERTKEIGVRKAVGARRLTILTQFLIESVFICTLGGLIGIALSFGLTAIVNTFLPTYLGTGTIALAFGICMLVGVGFGLAPAWTAAKANPIDALRYE